MSSNTVADVNYKKAQQLAAQKDDEADNAFRNALFSALRKAIGDKTDAWCNETALWPTDADDDTSYIAAVVREAISWSHAQLK